jgi:protein phosphatase
LNISYAAKTDLGRKRKVNEDSFFADPKCGLFMVLDGIGGHRAGEVASKLGVDTIRERVTRNLGEKDLQLAGEYNENLSREANILKDSFVIANKAIFDAARSETDHHGMGTTAASLLVGDKSIAIAHVGDSRIYLIREDTIEPLTEDHSLVMEQLKRGIITEEEARKSDMKNVITRALGADEQVNPTIDEILPQEDDVFLLTSDGLTDLVSDDEILNLVIENRGSLDRSCEALISKANARGGKDNTTTILVSITSKSNSFGRWIRSAMTSIANICSRDKSKTVD